MYFFPFSLSTFRNSCNFFANSVDPDQTPRSAASELGPHCLSMSFLHVWDAFILIYRMLHEDYNPTAEMMRS